MMHRLLIALATVPVLCACANLDPPTEPQEEHEIITGSHLLQRYRNDSRVLGMSREDVEDLLRRSGRPLDKPDRPPAVQGKP